MKILILLLVLLFSCSVAFAGYVEVGGFYTPTTKTYSGTAQASGTIVWAPATGKKIVLMGLIGSFSNAFATEAQLGTGIKSDGSGTFVDVISMLCLASGPIVVTSGVPIWQGATNGTLAVNTNRAVKGTFTIWGYEKD